jgi:hypothetical protein
MNDREAAAELIALCDELLAELRGSAVASLRAHQLAVRLRNAIRDELLVRGMGDAG